MYRDYEMVNEKYNCLNRFLRRLIDKKTKRYTTSKYVYRIIFLEGINTACVDRCQKENYHARNEKTIKWELIGTLPIKSHKPYRPNIFLTDLSKIG